MQNLFRSPNLWHKSVPQHSTVNKNVFSSSLSQNNNWVFFHSLVWCLHLFPLPWQRVCSGAERGGCSLAALRLLRQCPLGGKRAADRVITMCFTPDWDRASFVGITFCRCLDSESKEMAAWHNFVPCMNALRQPTLICHLSLLQFSVLGTSK